MSNITKDVVSPERVTQAAVELVGLITRTSNLAEQHVSTQKIGPLWQRYFTERMQTHSNTQLMYGVYYDYQSDMEGEFSVLAGTTATQDQICDLTLIAGEYLKFSAQGEMPQCVVNLWGEVWRYFASEKCEYQRSYLTDYEMYLDNNGVEIYIGIKP
ncbi:AraC family transcriptional regulator [Shewanella sp. Choline-02u-19]|uniref:GyrI-like domain-containing protein n=1 Tax=unclassified Shewanella TaxID=196818 RepID=UPI000C33E857|nr:MULTISPECIES: GyrI-like domain-containing protein [unclassified Shewanella]PKG74847.1 AraC family transcriptional regulator [Shewanella sp. GutCb]PKH53829.1 AraC family transcriptional regulator [Shewanella sp. Bg11-22]PKI28919.1 AraC family transcriptional regulator [Shewanella sp. Choline-02u-19]